MKTMPKYWLIAQAKAWAERTSQKTGVAHKEPRAMPKGANGEAHKTNGKSSQGPAQKRREGRTTPAQLKPRRSRLRKRPRRWRRGRGESGERSGRGRGNGQP